jgi:ATP-dependent Clp protease ATP-binding subunit ClpC
MFKFDFKKAKIYQAVVWDLAFVRFIKLFKIIFFILFILSFIGFIYGIFSVDFSDDNNRRLLGFSIIFLSLFISLFLTKAFFDLRVKQPKLKISIKNILVNPDVNNLAELLSFESAKTINKTLNRGPCSARLLFYLLSINPKLEFVFNRLILNTDDIKKELRKTFKTSSSRSFEEALLESLKIANEKGHSRIEVGDLLSALARTDQVFKRFLTEKNLKKDDIDNLTWWLENIEKEIIKKKRFWDAESLARRGSLAKEWTAGFTITLDKYAVDISRAVRYRSLEFIGHKEEIKIMERVLSRGEINNVLIVGEPGTGRKNMVYSLAYKSMLGQSVPSANYKRFVELDMSALLAQLESSEQVEIVLDKIFGEVAMAGNIILVINEIHNYIGQDPRPGVIDISGIIAPYLRLPQFQVIGIADYFGLHKNIERNAAILSLFSKIEVLGISPKEMVTLLQYMTFALERKHNVIVSYQAVREIISMTDRYLPDLHFPEKAVNILDEVVVYVATDLKERIIIPKHVAEVITQKTDIPVGEVQDKEREVLLNLEHLMHKRIINQVEAVEEVATALRRARSEITTRKGPMGTFLFLGPTGVGKTETCKALAEFYFGSEKKIIRMDMSEFQEVKDMARLIGSSTETGLLSTPVRESPFSLVLLDEIEKAHPNILNLFLQVLDEGYLTDGMGRKIDFKNSIIIATSNAGYKIILENLKSKEDWSGVKQKLLDYVFEQRMFRPEFINRFDAVVLFTPLSKDNLLNIAQLMLSSLQKNLMDKGIEFMITDELKAKIVELGYNPMFGAREMRRVVQDKVEDELADALLSNRINRGDKVFLTPDFKLVISNN